MNEATANTGTPIFTENAGSGGPASLRTTEQVFGDRLHTYTIVDAISDHNVLPFRVDYNDTVRAREGVVDKQVSAIDTTNSLAYAGNAAAQPVSASRTRTSLPRICRPVIA